jgi:putative ABC transport system permease protein
MLSLALATLRTRWTAFAGTFAALALGVSVIATMALVLAAADQGNANQEPQRFAAAAFVIRADPGMQVLDRYGDLDTVPFPEQPDVPAAVSARLPAAIPDRSFFAQVQGSRPAQPALGHGWSSAQFAPYHLIAGHAPAAADQIVVAGPATLGDQVTVLTAAGRERVVIVGRVGAVVGEQPIFFTDAQAARLSPGVDVLVTDDQATARAAAGLPGVQVLTGQARHLADPTAAADATELSGLTSFLGVAALLSAFVVITVTAAAFGLSVAQRRRDLALLRTIGATPRQVMRLVWAEALLIGVTGSVAGCVIGLEFAPVMARWIARRGLAPGWFSVSLTASSIPALVLAFTAGVAVAVLSVTVAAVRAGRIKPAEALREAVVEPRPLGRLRLAGGLVMLIGGVALAVLVAIAFPAEVADLKTEAMTVLLLVGGMALLVPFLLRPLSGLLPAGRGTVGMLTQAAIRTAPRRAAAALVPVLIAVGLSASVLGVTATTAASSAGLRGEAANAGYLVLPAGTPGLTGQLIEQVEGTAGVEATAVKDTTLLAYEPAITAFHLEAPMPITFGALGIDHYSPALALPVRQGSLAGLDDGTVAVDTSWGKHVGDTLRLWRPDGTPVNLRVIAVLKQTLAGASLIVDLRNSGSSLPSRLYLKVSQPAALARVQAVARADGARVVPAATWTAVVNNQQAAQNQAGLLVLVGIAIAYSAIGIASTIAVSTRGRAAEWALLRLAGATRKQITGIIVAEALVLTLLGVVASAAVAAVVLGALPVALARAGAATPLVLPWPLIAGVTGGAVLISAATSAIPGWLQFRPHRSAA